MGRRLPAAQKLQVRRSCTELQKKPGKAVWLSSQTKYIVENVRYFFKKHSVGMRLKRQQVVERTTAATGVSVRSVRNTHTQFQLEDVPQ